jgi:hypothetical protein
MLIHRFMVWNDSVRERKRTQRDESRGGLDRAGDFRARNAHIVPVGAGFVDIARACE